MPKETPKTNGFTHSEASVWHAEFGEALRQYLANHGVKMPPKENLVFTIGFMERGKNRRDSRPIYGEVHDASRHVDNKIAIIFSVEHPDDPEMVGQTMLKLLAMASTPPGPTYKRALEDNLVRLGMTIPARHSVADIAKTDMAVKAIAAALVLVGDRPKMKLTIPLPPKKPDVCRNLRLVCVGGTPENPCAFGPARAADTSRGLIACAIHTRDTVVVWEAGQPDPRKRRPDAELQAAE